MVEIEGQRFAKIGTVDRGGVRGDWWKTECYFPTCTRRVDFLLAEGKEPTKRRQCGEVHSVPSK